jgi:hypothetical protein
MSHRGYLVCVICNCSRFCYQTLHIDWAQVEDKVFNVQAILIYPKFTCTVKLYSMITVETKENWLHERNDCLTDLDRQFLSVMSHILLISESSYLENFVTLLCFCSNLQLSSWLFNDLIAYLVQLCLENKHLKLNNRWFLCPRH